MQRWKAQFHSHEGPVLPNPLTPSPLSLRLPFLFKKAESISIIKVPLPPAFSFYTHPDPRPSLDPLLRFWQSPTVPSLLVLVVVVRSVRPALLRHQRFFRSLAHQKSLNLQLPQRPRKSHKPFFSSCELSDKGILVGLEVDNFEGEDEISREYLDKRRGKEISHSSSSFSFFFLLG